MENRVYKIKSKLFKWQGESAWFFVRVDEKTTEDIKDNFGMFAKGWGSLPVNVTLGKSKWKTSIFPDKGTYLLPIKSQMRKKESISEGDLLSLSLRIIVESTEITAPPIDR